MYSWAGCAATALALPWEAEKVPTAACAADAGFGASGGAGWDLAAIEPFGCDDALRIGW